MPSGPPFDSTVGVSLSTSVLRSSRVNCGHSSWQSIRQKRNENGLYEATESCGFATARTLATVKRSRHGANKSFEMRGLTASCRGTISHPGKGARVVASDIACGSPLLLRRPPHQTPRSPCGSPSAVCRHDPCRKALPRPQQRARQRRPLAALRPRQCGVADYACCELCLIRRN